MSEFNEHKYYSLKHNHADIERLLHKIENGWVLTEKDYKQLIEEIGLNNISTFSGDFNDLLNKPNVSNMINEALSKLELLDESDIDEKIKIVRTELLSAIEQLSINKSDKGHVHTISDIDLLGNLINSKADKEHDHDETYYNKTQVDEIIQDIQDNIHGGSDCATMEDLSRLNELIAAKAESEHTHELIEIPELQSELNKKADKTSLNEFYKKDDVYSKPEVNKLLENISSSDHTHNEYYTKEEANNTFAQVDEILELTEDLASKSEVESLRNSVNSSLSNKADVGHVHNNIYTKEQVDEMIARVGSGGTVNLEGYIKQSQLEEAMATKADKIHSHDDYASKSHVHNLEIKDIAGLQEALDEKANDDGVDVPENILELINEKANINHSHEEYSLADHTHGIINIAGLQDILDSKANKDDMVSDSLLEEIQEMISGKADIEHTHNYSDIGHKHDDYAVVNHVHDEYANKNHEHDKYADKNHAHGEYAEVIHSHSEYALSTHDHQDITKEIESINERVDKKVDAIFVYTKEEIDDKLLNLDAGENGPVIDLGGYVKQSELYEALSSKAEMNHRHDDDYADKAHSHEEISDIQEALEKKANITEVPSNNDLTIALANKSDLIHGHEITDINNLREELDNKINRDELDLSITERLESIDERLSSKAELVHTHDEYANSEHNHDDSYYTKEEIDQKMADNGSSNEMLLLANIYTDNAISTLVQDAPENMNTFSKVSVAMQEERSMFETMIAGKADSNHVHVEYATVEQENARDIFETTELTVNAVGGINAGTDLNGLTVKEILTKLLFPYVAPTVSVQGTPNGGTYEKGNVQTITNAKVVVTKKSEKITKIQLFQGSTVLATLEDNSIANGGTFNFPVSVQVNSVNVQLTAKVTDAAGTIKQGTTGAFTFVYPYYVGVCSDSANIDSNLIKSLTKKVETKGTKSIAYTTNNQRMIFAYPKAYGSIVKIIDPNNFDVTSTFERKEVSVPCLDGTNQSYYVYINGASSVDDFTMKFNY